MHYYAFIDKQKMTFETVRFLGIITGSKRLVNLVEKKKEEEHKEDNEVCLAIEEMCTQQYEKGCSEGIELGRGEGEGNFAKLILCLTREQRNDDIEKVAMDEKYRHKLFREFGIEG